MAESQPYSYSRIRPNQIRLVRFIQDALQKQKDEVSAVLEIFSIEDKLPAFRALSYAWAAATHEDNGEGSSTINAKAKLAPKTWNIRIISEGEDGRDNIKDDNRVLPVLATLRPFIQVLMSKDVALQDHERDDKDDASSNGSHCSQWWWIDSICIDQANLTERAQQVQLMRFMYLEAEEVGVWLGEPSPDSELAMDFIEDLGKTMQQADPPWSITSEQVRAQYEIEEYRPQWRALQSFLSRSWWARIWTIQEFVIPPTLLFWCGKRAISRDTVCYALTGVDRCNGIGIKETRAFRYAYNRKRAWNLYEAAKAAATEKVNNGISHHGGRSQPLLSLTAYFSCMDATDDRDRLYGLRALATDGDFLDVDYTLSVEEVYLKFAQAFIERHKSLDIICFATVYSAASESLLPSWVPDWHRRDAVLSMPVMASQSCSEHVGNLRPDWTSDYDESISFCASANRPAVFEFQGLKLLAQGVIIDEIDGLSGSGSYPMTQSSTFIEPTDHRYSPIQILKSICKCLVLDRNDRFLRYPMPANDEFFRDFLGLCMRLIDSTTTTSAIGTESESIAKEIREWFEMTRSLEIHGRSFETILREGCRSEDNPCTSTDSPNQDEWRADTFFGRFFDTVERMALRLAFTRHGRIGMASEKARKGDLVCVLYGCNIPVLLRRRELSSSIGDETGARSEKVGKEEVVLVGECFLDGCMDGSALEQKDIVERFFSIL